MKISNTTPNYVNQAYNSQTNGLNPQDQKPNKPADETKADSINLSTKTKDLQKISKAVETEPVVRQDIVDDIKNRIENNQYNINAEGIAQKIIDGFF